MLIAIAVVSTLLMYTIEMSHSILSVGIDFIDGSNVAPLSKLGILVKPHQDLDGVTFRINPPHCFNRFCFAMVALNSYCDKHHPLTTNVLNSSIQP